MKTARQLIQESQYFSETENWGDIDKLDPRLIELLINLREFVNAPIVIHNAYETSGHSTNSQHYQGKACDFHIKGLEYKDAVMWLENWLSMPFYNERMPKGELCGFGIYPFWNNPGFHLDTRGIKARWGFDKRNKQVGYEAVRKTIFT